MSRNTNLYYKAQLEGEIYHLSFPLTFMPLPLLPEAVPVPHQHFQRLYYPIKVAHYISLAAVVHSNFAGDSLCPRPPTHPSPPPPPIVGILLPVMPCVPDFSPLTHFTNSIIDGILAVTIPTLNSMNAHIQAIDPSPA